MVVVNQYLLTIGLHLDGFLTEELIVVGQLCLHSDCFFDDHEEMREVLKIVIGLLILPKHQISYSDIVFNLFLRVNPIFKDRLQLFKQILLLLLCRHFL